MNIEGHLERACQKAGVELKHCGNGHFQIKGALLVNYWPLTAKKRAYIAGTTKSFECVDIDKAVAMALQIPESQQANDKRKKSYVQIKIRMLRKSNCCHWCNTPLVRKTATIDHVIPLSRGGLDNSNNRVLACQPCNSARGSQMPEVKQKVEAIKKQVKA